jgi:hypothetical protein
MMLVYLDLAHEYDVGGFVIKEPMKWGVAFAITVRSYHVVVTSIELLSRNSCELKSNGKTFSERPRQ